MRHPTLLVYQFNLMERRGTTVPYIFVLPRVLIRWLPSYWNKYLRWINTTIALSRITRSF